MLRMLIFVHSLDSMMIRKSITVLGQIYGYRICLEALVQMKVVVNR
jgi:hypothetical protein